MAASGYKGSGHKGRKGPRDGRRRGRPQPPPGTLGVTRRAVLAGGAVVLAAGFGVGTLIRRHAAEVPAAETPEATVAIPQQQARATTAPIDPLMEEAPLPSDVYVSKPIVPTQAAAPLTATPATAAPPDASASSLLPSTRPAVIAGTPRWQANARPLVEAGDAPVVAIVIDDLGLDERRTEWTLGLDRNLTLAFMTYAEGPGQWEARARAARHELLVHVPMQPLSPGIDPGPNALTVGLSEAEILGRLRWGLDRYGGYVGANNHMGSRFTEDAAGMRVVLDELRARGLLFLDSRTTGRSACGPVAAAVGLPFASRNVFLDNDTSASAVRGQIAVLEDVARRHGTAIGIGHPHDGTLTALAEWLPLAASRGIAVVPLTSAMRIAAERA